MLTDKTKPVSMYRFAMLVLKSGLSTNRKKNSYTICRCGHANSSTGSSSSGSYASPLGLTGGGIERNRLEANCNWSRQRVKESRIRDFSLTILTTSG
jgi:hypothetical protein